MMQKSALRTEFSLQASSLAESYRNTVGRLTVGPHGYRPDMTAPPGQSTGGGVQALQHLRLLPPSPNMPTILVGHANQRDRVAEIRTWEHVDAICRERFKQGAPLDPAAYQEFLQAAQGFLAACGLRVSVVPTPESMRTVMADRAVVDDGRVGGRFAADLPAPKKRNLAVGITGGVVALAIAVAVWMLVVAR